MLKYKKIVGKKYQGRNGRRNGSHSRTYRHLQHNVIQINVVGKVQTIEHDPNRSGQIAGILYKNGRKEYHLCPEGLRIGANLVTSSNAPLILGNTLPLKNIPLGTNIYNIESTPGSGRKLVRAAGTTALLMAKFETWVTLRLPSSEVRLFSQYCWATVGQVSNINHFNKRLKKAGRSRWLGIHPTVRGSAKNPVDHPHGGGEGRAPIGRSHPVTPWGQPTLGKRTRRTKKYSDALILKRR
uniref:Large ribosomal subunit protein uL2m n=1 Tax=Rhipiliopsis peltata TaxID=2320810 RepID=A0A386B1C9_9CHLO|nr:ribosomal protein L2 [Rhipiliopsis peltata]AYC65473.1 ribosomal protein L2 [Rhipiliopsis peltata]